MDMERRLAAAASLAQSDGTEASPDADMVAAHCRSWGVSAHLKPHQAQGVAWLIRKYIRGVNVILGDEMGLGKTLQAITFISYLKSKRGSSGPFLVLCPLSVIDGWSSEFLQFAPKLQVLRYVGSKDERAVLSRKICEHINQQPPTSWDDPSLPFDVLLTTYELAMIDMAFLSRFRWRYTIIDEAQRLKNSTSVLYKTLEGSFMMPRRLLLSGTPVQNNLSELWALLHFCMPLVFNNLEGFLKTFPIAANHGLDGAESGKLKLLRSVLNVFMLRRTKAALVQNKSLILPSLSEVTIMARLVPLQKNIYVSVLKKELPKLVSNFEAVSQQSLQNIVVQLRKACSHPYLFDGVESEPFQEGEHLIEASGKLMILDSLLDKLYEQKHRVLIFAQMTRTLDILQDYLEFRGYLYERLDGSVRAEERFIAVRSFNADSVQSHSMQKDLGGSMHPFVFLLTTRAGGVGLNLTAADTVIFYEQDWNPQADKQALQRAHRIGQTRPVLAINLVAEDTVEEVILSRSKKKLKLTHDVIGCPDSDVETNGIEIAKPSDLQSMITFGLHKLDPSDIHQSQKEESMMSQIGPLVHKALHQRNKQDTGVVQDGNSIKADLEENIYSFEGHDFSANRRRGNEKDMPAPADQAVIDSFIKRAGEGSDQELNGRRIRKQQLDTETETKLEDYQAAKQRKSEQRKNAKWESLGYRSMALHDPGDISRDLLADVNGSNVHLVFGDCTKPLTSTTESIIVLSTVDDSGMWGSGGMFRVLEQLSEDVQEAYVAAHTAGDLHVGDLHLVPISDVARKDPSVGQGDARMYVALAISQSYDRRRKIPRSDISLSSLETCLRKVSAFAASKSASIHMPRIGSRPGQDRKEWYAIERLLRKYASFYGVQIFVYYYKKPAKG